MPPSSHHVAPPLGLGPLGCLAALLLQILTQEDWNVVLYNGMASTSSWAALYFVALMTFGNYVLFNLLVAILVEGFQAEVRGTSRRWEPARCGGSCTDWLERPLFSPRLPGPRHAHLHASPASPWEAPHGGAWHRWLPPRGASRMPSALRGTGRCQQI